MCHLKLRKTILFDNAVLIVRRIFRATSEPLFQRRPRKLNHHAFASGHGSLKVQISKECPVRIEPLPDQAYGKTLVCLTFSEQGGSRTIVIELVTW